MSHRSARPLRWTLITVLCVFIFGRSLASPPPMVPDRPGYSDSTAAVAPGHWHFELGSSYQESSLFGLAGLIRYGLSGGWELRVSPPSLSALTLEGEPLWASGAPLLGAKWATRLGGRELSTVATLGLPLKGLDSPLPSDPVLSATAQLNQPLSDAFSAGFGLKVAALDSGSAYAEALQPSLGAVSSLAWSRAAWSLFVQGVVERADDRFKPLFGVGATLLILDSAQLDLSTDINLSGELSPIYMLGLTLSR